MLTWTRIEPGLYRTTDGRYEARRTYPYGLRCWRVATCIDDAVVAGPWLGYHRSLRAAKLAVSP